MVSEIVTYWQQTMNSFGKSNPEVTSYLKTFFRGKNTALMAKMLIQPLSLDLVHAALESLNGTSAPGIDAVQVSIYKAFSDFFCSFMLDIKMDILASNTLNNDWSLALLNPISKGLRTASVHNFRPLVLQNTSHKWVAAILALQRRDYIDVLTPIQQLGFIRGRSIYTNLWHIMAPGAPRGMPCFAPSISRRLLTLFHTSALAHSSTLCNYQTVKFLCAYYCLQRQSAGLFVITFIQTTK